MASGTLNSNRFFRVLTYGRNLLNTTRVMSSMRLYSKFQDGDEQNVNQSLTSETMSGWPDEFLGPLAPTNQKFPLPGNISVHHGDITKPKYIM